MGTHKITTTPRSLGAGRRAWDTTCRCSWSSGSYISDDSAQAAGHRHLAAVAAGA